MPFLESPQTKASSTLFMKRPESGQNWRLLKRNKNGMPSEMRISQRNGVTVAVGYDDNGRPAHINDYAAPTGEQAQRFNIMTDALEELPRLRRTEISDNYKIVAQQTFRSNGTLKTSAKRDEAYDLEVTTYSDSDQSVESVETFENNSNGKGTLKKAVYYRADHTVAAVVHSAVLPGVDADKRPFTARDNLRADGTLESRSYFLSSWQALTYDYSADGLTALHSYTYGYGQVRVAELDPQTQKAVVQRSYRDNGEDQRVIDVQFVDKATGATVTQNWLKPQVLTRAVRGGTGKATAVQKIDQRILNQGYFLLSAKIQYPAGHTPSSYTVQYQYGTRKIRDAISYVPQFGVLHYSYRTDGSLDFFEWVKMEGPFARGVTKMPPGRNTHRQPKVAEALTRALPLLPLPSAEQMRQPKLPAREFIYRLTK